MDAPLDPGAVVAGRYVVVRALGRGGMAWVYRARHTGLGRDVALKLLPPSPEPDAEVRFEREAQNAAGLDHPGCVRVLDSGRDGDGSRFLAMELLPGPTLREELGAGEPLSPEAAVRIGCDLLDALAHAHGAGVLHRDVKPENVMFRERDGVRRAVLIDFGLSRVDEDAPLTAAGACVGSPSYLAPERVRGEDYDARADVYAVGVVMFELLAGERPFRGGSPAEIARQHMWREPPALEEVRPGVPGQLAEVVDEALAKRPENRFGSAGEMREALADSLRAAPTADDVVVDSAADTREMTAPVEIVTAAPPPWWQRLYAWLRYGAWRRPRLGRGAALPPAPEATAS